MKELLVATRSAGKLRELVPMCEALGYRAVSLDDVGISESSAEAAIEVWDTFEDNALAKARYFARLSGGRPVLADDSGLTAEALGGAPGVHSKRWSGRPDLEGAALDAANNQKLLAALEGSVDRRARYVCVAVWVDSDGGREWEARGECHGRILEVARGDGGFGYDPYFWSDDLGCSFGEASREAKSEVSHRGRALRALWARVRAGR